MFKPSKEDIEKFGMTPTQRFLEILALSMTGLALVAFFLKILFF